MIGAVVRYISGSGTLADALQALAQQSSAAPGPPGPPGPPGVDAFTLVTAPGFTQPAVSGNVLVPVVHSVWAFLGQPVFVENGGQYVVAGVPDATHLTLTNTGAPGNAAPGAAIPVGSGVSPSGASGVAAYPVPDNIFAVGAAADLTRQIRVDASAQAPGTATTITLGATVSRPFRLPDLSGTAVVQEDVTGFVFLGQTTPLHGSNSRVQLASLVANGAQYRAGQYGANTGVPGVSSFKSRGATIGSLAPVAVGDVIFRATAVGVTDNLSIPLGGLISIQVPAGGVPIGAGWVATEYELQLVPLAGPANGRRISFKVTSEGETQSLRGVRAGSETAVIPAAAAAAAIATGALWSSGTGTPNGVLTGSPGDFYSRLDGGPGATIWTKETGVATNTGWAPFRNQRGPIVSSYPSAGGKPAVMRVDGNGILWLIDFGAGGVPNKVYGIESYDITTNPLAPKRLGSWLQPANPFFNAYQLRFRGTTGFFSAGGPSNQLRAVDCSAPALPVLLGSIATAGLPEELVLSANLLTAVVGNQGGAGIQFFDITTPAAMTLYAAATVPALTVGGMDSSAWPTLYATDVVTGTLRVYDCTGVPPGVAPPTLLGTLLLTTGVRRVTIDNARKLAFVVQKTEQQISIVDITNPAAMTVLSVIPIGVGTSDEVQPVLFTYTPPGGAAINVLLQCTTGTSPGRIETWDVTTPAAPKILKQVEAAQNLFYADITKLAQGAIYASNRGGEQELLTLDVSFLLPAA